MWLISMYRLCGVCQSDVEGRTVAQLRIRHAQREDFHIYTLVAENRVSVAAKDVPLVHSQSSSRRI